MSAPPASRGRLLGEPAHHIAGENQEAAPRDEEQHRVLRQARLHADPLRRLKEEDERGDEQAGNHRKAGAAIEARQDDRQIIEAEKRKLLLDQLIDDEQGCDQQQDEDALEVAEEELLRTLQRSLLNHTGLSAKGIRERRTKLNERWAFCK